MRIHAISSCPLSSVQKRRLERWGELVYYDARLGDPSLADKCRGAEAMVITPRLHIDIIPVLDRCRVIAVQAIGTDAINLTAATAKSIAVCNVPDFCSAAVAEHAFALLLAVARQLERGKAIILKDDWHTGLAYGVLGLRDKTLGIFGFGKIAQHLAQIGHGFGMKVIATTKNPDAEREAKHNIKFVTFERLLVESDCLILAAPATPETRGIFSQHQFERMKQTAIFVNISRGALVDETALADNLRRGGLAGAGLDVFAVEPLPRDSPLLGLDNAVLTPHVAWGTTESVQTVLDTSIENVEAFLEGRPQNVVNPEVLARS